MSIIGNFPQDPYEPIIKQRPPKAPSIDEPSPSKNDNEEDDLGWDEGILSV